MANIKESNKKDDKQQTKKGVIFGFIPVPLCCCLCHVLVLGISIGSAIFVIFFLPKVFGYNDIAWGLEDLFRRLGEGRAFEGPGGPPVFIPLHSRMLKLNFTDAQTACQRHSIFGKLARLYIPHSQKQEDGFMKKYLSRSADYLNICKEVFIGIRVRYLEKYENAYGDGYILPPEFMGTLNYPNPLPIWNCVVVEPEDGNLSTPINERFIYSHTDCHSSIPCSLCVVRGQELWVKKPPGTKTNCPPTRNAFCYWQTELGHRLQVERCSSDKLPVSGRLAIMGSRLTYEQAYSLVHFSNDACKKNGTFLAKIKENIILETYFGNKLKYDTTRLPEGMDLNNCVVATTDPAFPFKFVPCWKKFCYVCQFPEKNPAEEMEESELKIFS